MQSQQHNVKQFHRCGILQKVTRLEANSDAACCQDSDQELNTMVLGGLHRKLGLTQELSFCPLNWQYGALPRDHCSPTKMSMWLSWSEF